MTSRERLFKAFRREVPDRVPVAPMVSPGWLKMAGGRAGEFVREMDLMMDVHINTDIEIYTGGKTKEITAVENRGREIIEVIRTPKGDLTRVSNTDPNMLNWVTKHFFEDNADAEKFLSVEYAPFLPDAAEFLKEEERIGDEGIVMPLIPDAVCLPGLWMPPDKFMLTCMDDFGLVKELIETASGRVIQYVDALCKLGIRCFRIAGAELASQTLMGTGWYEKLVAPYDKKLIDVIHGSGGVAFYHCHGRMGAIIDEIADIGIDALSPLEEPPNGDISLVDAKRKVGGRICLVGNLDDMEFIGKKSGKEIEAKSRELIRDIGKDGGFVLGGTESGVYTERMLEGFMHMAEAGKKYGRYKKSED